MFADSITYPANTVAGMYKQEQEISKAEDAGLFITAADLGRDSTTLISCNNCNEPCPWEVISDRGLCPDCEFE
ncbi:hypothetical protein 6939_0021 [Klebsiella phage 6939]|uniref:Uncharacterized protein n=1 Tax=Klebsiella phage 6939 TaxID=2912295 RepID=A0A9E7SB21_9CAUD|nr:hypothetical protein 6939_0021 [Klebsiella phage 6939]